MLSATRSNTWSIVIQAWFVILATLFGIGVLTMDRYDVWRVLLPIAIGWYLLGALLLGYRGEHRRRRSVSPLGFADSAVRLRRAHRIQVVIGDWHETQATACDGDFGRVHHDLERRGRKGAVGAHHVVCV